MNNSLSVTLERFYTETRVTFDASLTEDQLILNKEAVNAKERQNSTLYGYDSKRSWYFNVCTHRK